MGVFARASVKSLSVVVFFKGPRKPGGGGDLKRSLAPCACPIGQNLSSFVAHDATKSRPVVEVVAACPPLQPVVGLPWVLPPVLLEPWACEALVRFVSRLRPRLLLFVFRRYLLPKLV